ncbi:MAG: LysR family transcriptional regulator [Clostridiales bacterium]|nr:LysR family transcriptional regulator [Clostridiales bacterium]
MIEMRLLEILTAFAEEGTQAAAAEKLHISQPTLSGSMKKLEEEIGAPLFERTRNRMALNENGQAAAEFAGRILREEAAMRKHIQELERRKHTVSVATCTISALNRLSLVLAQAFPGRQVTTSLNTDTEALQEELFEGAQTFIITDHPLMDERAYCFPCYTEHLFVYVPEDAPQAGERSLAFAQLKDVQLLIHGNGGAWEQLLRRNMKPESLLPQSSFSDFGKLVESLPVWAFASDTFVRMGVPPHHVAVPISDADAHLDYWCSCLKAKKKEADLLRSFL